MSPPRDDMEAAAPHWREAFGLAWAFVGDRARAEELTQEAFVRLGSMRRAPDRGQPIAPLLFAIVRNLALDELRRRRHESLDDDAHEQDSRAARVEADPASSNPAHLADRAERRERVRAALARLSPTSRAVLYLRDGLDYSYRQIAETLEKSEDVVRVTLHRARARVRAWTENLEPRGEST